MWINDILAEARIVLTITAVFRVYSKKIPARDGEIPVVVRIYGNNTEAIIDRKKELIISSCLLKASAMLSSATRMIYLSK